MDTLKQPFSFTVRIATPALGSEWRYVATEREYAERKLQETVRRPWLFFSYPGLGILRQRDWREYLRALDHYEKQVGRLADELRHGLLPVKLEVANTSDKDDQDIVIKTRLEAAAVLVHKKPPKRPARIDGAPDKSDGVKFSGFGRFVRSGISIQPHRVEATFSGLKAHDGALVVNQTLYLDTGKGARLHYQIESRNVRAAIAGEVELN